MAQMTISALPIPALASNAASAYSASRTVNPATPVASTVRLTVSKPELQAPMVSALETRIC